MRSLLSFSLVLPVLLSIGCNEAKFSGKEAGKQCKNTETSIGAQVAFLIDNSNSNAETDCPGATAFSSYEAALGRTIERYECKSSTNREQAVKSAYTILRDFSKSASKKEPELSKSELSISSFPSANDFREGYNIETPNWYATVAETEGNLSNSLAFTRKPLGFTPYGAGLKSAKEMFVKLGDKGKKNRLAVMVTDGEPTDRNPAATIKLADELRSLGVEVVTVFVAGKKTREDRRNEHMAWLRRNDTSLTSAGQGTWYDKAQYKNVDEYLRDLMGDVQTASLIQRMTSKRDPNCQDQAGALCERRLIEVSDSSALKSVLDEIVSETVRCE